MRARASTAAALVAVTTLALLNAAGNAQSRKKGHPKQGEVSRRADAAMANTAAGAVSCQATGPLRPLAGLPEASGLAVSRRVPGRFWTHNDSATPTLTALDRTGRITGQLTLSGARVDDWEAVETGPCPAGSCVYVGDIGDNDEKRRTITVYRAPEPDAALGAPARSEALTAVYPDGPHNAETLLVARDRLFIVTKERTPRIYAFPASPQPGQTMALTLVGASQASARPLATITGGAVSNDGQWVVLRNHDTLAFYRADDLLQGRWREAGRTTVAMLGEPQGEGVAFGDEARVLFVAGEGKRQGGTFGRLECDLARLAPAG